MIDPKDYKNPRYVEIKNSKVEDLYKKILEHQEKVNPKLKRYQEIEDKKAELKKPYDDYVAETKQEQEDLMEFMQNEDQLASKVKQKIVPLVEEEVLPHLGELDEFVGLEQKDEGLVAKINDRVEEFVKAIRNQNEESKEKVAQKQADENVEKLSQKEE